MLATYPLPQRSKAAKRKLPLVPFYPLPVTQQAVVVPPKNSAKTKRNRRRRVKQQLVGENATTIISPNLPVNPIMPLAMGVSTSSRKTLGAARLRLAKPYGGKVSTEGMRFLKCAFSAPDFDGSGTYGVPDNFSGKSVAIKHRAVVPQTFAANTDYYFLIPPTPGASYYTCTKTAGTPLAATDVFSMFTYSDYNSIFEPVSGTANQTNAFVQKFRYVSQHFELCPTTNAMQWTGNVQSWKLPCQASFTESTDGTGNQRLTISGLMGCNATDADMYSGPFNLGVYVGAYNKGSEAWEFRDIWRIQPQLPASIQTGDFSALNGNGGSITGFDNSFETILVKVSGIGSNTLNTALIRTWACVEYQFTPGTVMYEMQNLKCINDSLALEVYRRVISELPTAVSFIDNANFWMRVLSIIKQISGGLSILPGPYGMVAGGVNMVSRGIENLTM